MKPILPTLTAIAFVALACLTVSAQDLLIEPPSIDFGATPIGYRGESETNRVITLSNPTNDPLIISSCDFLSDSDVEQLILLKPSAAEARAALREISTAIYCFRQDFREDPRALQELTENGYIALDSSVCAQWRFSWEHVNPVAFLLAVSTEQMPEGADHLILYIPESGDFRGYGMFEEAEIEAGAREQLVVSYMPQSFDRIIAFLRFHNPDWELLGSVFLSGEGFLPDLAALSSDQVSFGNILVPGRSRIEIILTNPSRLACSYLFDFSDDDRDRGSYCIYLDSVNEVHAVILDILTATRRFSIDFGRDPLSIEELREEGYLSIPDEIARQWMFHLIGANPITQIEALSTPAFPDGASLFVIYDLEEDVFLGYGAGFEMDVHLAPGRSQRFFLEFVPNAPGVKRAVMTVTASNEILEHISPTLTDSITVALSGNGVLTVPAAGDPSLPQLLSLSPAYPNPFNNNTRIDYSLPSAGWVQLKLYDLGGRAVVDLVDGVDSPGMHSVALDGGGLAAGSYWLILEQNGASAISRLELIK